jgi:hypothetical protein
MDGLFDGGFTSQSGREFHFSIWISKGEEGTRADVFVGVLVYWFTGLLVIGYCLLVVVFIGSFVIIGLLLVYYWFIIGLLLVYYWFIIGLLLVYWRSVVGCCLWGLRPGAWGLSFVTLALSSSPFLFWFCVSCEFCSISAVTLVPLSAIW